MRSTAEARKRPLLATALVIAGLLNPAPVRADTPAGVAEYLVPFDEDVFAYVTDPVTTGTIGPNITTRATIDVTAWSNPIKLYYDHWEDGYELDPIALTGADEVYTLNIGETLSFLSTNVPRPRTGANGNTYIGAAGNCTGQPAPKTPDTGTRTTFDFCYDGRDRFVTVGGATTVTRGGWFNGANGALGKLAAVGEEVYPLAPQLIKYIVPFGEDATRADYERVMAVVQATEDNTTLRIDFNGDGVFDSFNTENGYRTARADPTDATTITLQRGQTYVVDRDSDGVGGTLPRGVVILGDKTLQVEYFYGEADSGYNTRAVAAYPRGFWGNEYYAPVDGSAIGNTDVTLYNPNAGTITIDWQTTTGSGSFTMAANETAFFQAKTGAYVPNGSALYLRGSGTFWGISDVDSNSANRDWSYSLVPSYLLQSDQFVSWAPGNIPVQNPPGTDGRASGIFVTPVQDRTTFFIDRDADGTPDTTFEVLAGTTAVTPTGSGYQANRLQSLYITDNDGDLTGAHIWATGPFAMAYGENPDRASDGGGIDLGYTVLPSPGEWMDLALTVDKSANPVVLAATAPAESTFTIVVESHLFNLDTIEVVDTLPASWNYVLGSATITYPDLHQDTGAAADPTTPITLPTLTWPTSKLGGMLPNQRIVITFKGVTTANFTPGALTQNNVQARGTRSVGAVSQTFTARDFAFNTYLDRTVNDMTIAKTTGAADPVSPGDTIPYTVVVSNPGSAALTGVNLYDPIPQGVTYVPGSSFVRCGAAASRTYVDNFGTVAYNNSNGTANWSGKPWVETDATGGGATSGQVLVTGGSLRLRQAVNVRDQFGTQSYANSDGATNWAGNWTETDAYGTGSTGATGGYVWVTGGALQFRTLPTTTTVADDFATQGYSGNTGTASWATAWTENNDDVGGLPNAGDIQVDGDQRIEFRDTTDGGTPTTGESIQRTANVAGQTAVTVQFLFDPDNGLDADDDLIAEYSANGGASWTTLGTFDGDSVDNTTYTYPLVWNPANATIILRFRAEDAIEAGEEGRFDNVQISYDVPASAVGTQIRRTANLVGATSASLTFAYTGAGLGAEDTLVVEASSDGTSFTTLATYSSGTANGTKTFDLMSPTNYASANTTIRFRVTGGFTAAETVTIDDVDIAYSLAAPAVQRTANLTGSTVATLSFTIGSGGLATGDTVVVEASSSASGPFTTLGTSDGGAAFVPAIGAGYNILTYVSANTTIRFRITGGFGTPAKYFTVDGVTITYTSTGFPASDPPTMVPTSAGCSIAGGGAGTATLTFSVTVDNPFPAGQTEILNVATAVANEIPLPVSDDALNRVNNPSALSATVGDRVWLDADGDAVLDVGESGLAGVELTLKDQWGTPLQVTTTDSQGRYLFVGVPPGTGYYVDVTGGITGPNLLGNVADAFDTNGSFAGSTGTRVWATNWAETGDDASASGGDIRIQNNRLELIGSGTLTGGELIQRSAAAPANTTAIAVQYSWGSTGLLGSGDDMVVEYSTNGTTWTALRTLNGNLPAGDYTDGATVPTGTATVYVRYRAVNAIEAGKTAIVDNVQVTFIQGTAGLIQTTDRRLDLRTNSFDLAAGQDYETADLGFRSNAGTATVGDLVWSDADGDGVRDAGEPGLGAVTVQLLEDTNGDGTGDANPAECFGLPQTLPYPACTTTTAADGSYLFTGIVANGARDYVVYVNTSQTALSGYTQTTASFFGFPNVPAGASYVTADFGFRNTAATYSITDRVWFDGGTAGVGASNGLQDGTELGIAGVTVDLLNASGTTIATATTTANGNFQFTGVPAGQNYTWRITDAFNVLNGTFGTTASALAGQYQMTGTLSGPLDFTDTTPPNDPNRPHFGYNVTRAIGDTVFNDSGAGGGGVGNGAQDGTEAGINGVVVQLYRDVDGDGVFEPGAADGAPVGTLTTDANGKYLFTGLSDGVYWVSIDSTQSALSGYSVRSTGDDEPNAGDQREVALSPSNPSDLGIDYGYRAPAGSSYALSGRLWNDLNGNGDDNAEPGFTGVTLELVRNGVVIGTTTTDSSGNYSFSGLPGGSDYTVRITDVNGVLSGYGTTFERTELKVAPFNGQETVTNLSANVGNINFGFYKPQPTYALISGFRAYVLGGQPVVEWTTAGELGTTGFDLYRAAGDANAGGKPYAQVNREVLGSLIGAPVGGKYHLADAGATAGQTYTYRLREHAIGPTGATLNWYGPYVVRVETTTPADAGVGPGALAGGFHSAARELTPDEQLRHEGSREAIARAASDRAGSPTDLLTLKLFVQKAGIYFVPAAQLREALGIDPKTFLIQKLVSLSYRGRPVASQTTAEGIYFYNPGYEDVYTDTGVFFLTLGKRGLAMTTAKVSPTGVPTGNETFPRTIEVEKNTFAIPGLGLHGPEDDFWVWDFFRGGAGTACGTVGTKCYTLSSPGRRAGSAQLVLDLVGGTDRPANPDHHVVILVNGIPAGEARWNGVALQNVTLSFDAGLLHDGPNTVSVQAVNDYPSDPGFYSIFYLDRIRLTYPSVYRADGDQLAFDSSGAATVQATGFSVPDVKLLILSSATAAPVWVTPALGRAGTGDYTATFDTAAKGRYVAAAGAGLLRVTQIWPDIPSRLRVEDLGADYLVIAPYQLLPGAERLAGLREAAGHRTAVIDLEDILDEYNAGFFSPWAIRSFLKDVWSRWRTPPRYIALAGAGSYDYRNYMGYSDCLVPSFLSLTPYGLAASDTLLADVSGDDGVPEMAVGRLPVVTDGELQAYVDKLRAYEQAVPGPWTRRVLLVADNPDGAGNFPSDSDAIGTGIPSPRLLTKVYLDYTAANRGVRIAEARSAISTALNGGVAFFNYQGHGAVHLLADEALLTLADVAAMQNNGMPPIASFLTCSAANYALPGYDSMGEALMLRASGGAVAVWGPTGLSLNESARAFGQLFYAGATGAGRRVLGDVVLDAQRAAPIPTFMHVIYNLLGDPATAIAPVQ